MVFFFSLLTANNSSASILNGKKLESMEVMWRIVARSQNISYKFGHCFRTVQEKNGHTHKQVLN